MKKIGLLYKLSLIILLIACYNEVIAQDKVYLKDGTVVTCRITEIKDFILYAEVHDDSFLATFFADDVSHLDIDPNNSMVIRQLKKGVKEAIMFSNPLKENSIYGFYFGMPYDSVYHSSNILYKSDSSGNPVLVPYDPLEKDLSYRIKSLAKSIGANTLWELIGGL